MNTGLEIAATFVIGASCGYALCRNMLHAITIQVAGRRIAANIFGYPER